MILSHEQAEKVLGNARRAAEALVDGDVHLARLQVERIVDVLADELGRDAADRAEWEAHNGERADGDRRDAKEVKAANSGFRTGAHKCSSCQRFTASPVEPCVHCGNTELTHNATAREVTSARQNAGYR